MRATEQRRIAADHRDSFGPRLDLTMAWTCPWEEIAHYPVTPTSAEDKGRPSRVQDDEWFIPSGWCPPNRWGRARRLIDFNRAVPPGWDTAAAEGLKRRLKRMALLDWVVTLRVGSRGEISSPPVPASWARKTQDLIAAARHAVETYKPAPEKARKTPKSSCPDGPTIFALLSPEDFTDFKGRFINWGHRSMARLNGLFAFGLMDDWPANDVTPGKIAKRQGSKADQPLSDAAFTEIVRAALWLSALTEEVLIAYLRVKNITTTPEGRRRHGHVQAHRTTLVQAWSPAAIRSGDVLPYALRLDGALHRAFPLEGANFRALADLLALCQTAIAVLTLGSTGMRIGELIGLRPDALRKDRDRCYIDGPSYKTNDGAQGQPRSWPLPRITADAFESQRKVQAALASTDYLWVTLAGESNVTGVPNLDRSVTKFGDAVLMPDGRKLSDVDGKVSPHRYRYSVTRLVALSLEGVTQIMFDVLGHDDKEVTLSYMLRDRELREDIDKVRREVRAVRVKEVFDRADEHGGKAAEFVRKVKTEMLARSGQKELETEDVLEAANILGTCEVVRPGVLCTAQPLERGACSSNLGIRDFAACSTSCLHRLELAAKRVDRRKNLDFMLNKIVGAELFERAFMHNQILANLQPFPDLIDEFASDPRPQAALVDCDPHRWAALESELRERLDPLLGMGS
jgi:integrase